MIIQLRHVTGPPCINQTGVRDSGEGVVHGLTAGNSLHDQAWLVQQFSPVDDAVVTAVLSKGCDGRRIIGGTVAVPVEL